ncbi:MAG: VOC family protein [Hyphomicrobiales bacterium]|nr:VOC family protein [Hyphomicrobiales bacterium]
MSESVMREALNGPGHIGAIALHVRDPERVSAFYRNVLGLMIVTPAADAVCLGAPDGTVLLELLGGSDLKPADPSAPGLFHMAFLLPARRDLANWVAQAQALGVRIDGASDHLVSEAIYLTDPEGNGIEVYVDRPRALWGKDGSMVRMATLPLDGASLMAEQDMAAGAWRFPAPGRIGHVHLKVGDLAAAEAFYRDTLGLTVMARYPGASFLGWGGYHHHIAVNVWHSRGQPARTAGNAGLARVGLVMPNGPAHAELTDPAGNRLITTPQASPSMS